MIIFGHLRAISSREMEDNLYLNRNKHNLETGYFFKSSNFLSKFKVLTIKTHPVVSINLVSNLLSCFSLNK